jgi:XTP/dITP diphosphohydrolase
MQPIMTRRFAGHRLVIASHNQGKVREIGDLLRPFAIETVSVAELGLPVPDEDGTSFAENARIKALAAATAAGMPALADDSGLAVDALGGQPGIDSALWGGPDRDFGLAMRRVEAALAGATDRRAHFVCALALAWPDGHCEVFEGVVHGRLVWPPRGERGFGYDPMFIANGRDVTFGEMDPNEKHQISHRADAFRKLLAACFNTHPAG